MADPPRDPSPPPPGIDHWERLAPGDPLTVVKLAPNGAEAARYPAEVVSWMESGSWLLARAIWTYQQVEAEGLAFSPGDVLSEWFSPHDDFNAFAVYAPDGRFKGWYANVTYPAQLDVGASPPVLTWHDLYLDAIVLDGGAPIVCDEDELAASGLAENDPQLVRRIERARDEILHRLERRLPPFAAGAESAP